MEELVKNKKKLQVLTDTGWSDFDGVIRKGARKSLIVKTETHSVVCTPEHEFFHPNLEKVRAAALCPGKKIICKNKTEKVVMVSMLDTTVVYDLLNVKNGHRFYANNILVSNCEFIINDETLINAVRLAELEGIEPIERQAQVRWYKKPAAGNVYCVSLDPSLGTGGDPAAIQVFELPSLEQVAEWQHNKTTVQHQVRIMREIVNGLAEITGTSTDIYYSLENNTLGEAALVCITDLGEETFRGIFLSEPARSGHVRRFRKGFNTTHKTKLAACSKLKNLIETKKLIVRSKNLISELKTYVAQGVSFAAKPGETDDLVSSTLLIIRMVQVIQTFDANIDKKLQSDSEDFIEPMPFILLR